jgi:hypothetical protein
MIPPAPTRMLFVLPATCPMTTEVAALAIARKVVMLRDPVAMIAPLFRVLREIDRISEGQRRVAALNDRGKVENGKKRHDTE